MNDFGIYVHVPFCEKKCKYCSFVSGLQNQDVQTAYFSCLNKEIFLSHSEKSVTSVFFGGGTPSAVSAELIVSALNCLRSKFKIEKNAEISLEANPNSASFEKLQQYFNAGFNRISFGVQSFSNAILKKLGRIHSQKDVFVAVKNAKDVGFNNIGIDLILGVQTLNKNSFEKNIEKLKKLGVTHISTYILMLEQGTILFDEVKKGNTTILSDEQTVNQYYCVKSILEKYGFMQYEISNFALSGYESKHNQNYWQSGEYLGFGISAHSFVDGVRYENTTLLKEYLDFDSLNQIQQNKEILSIQQKIEEHIMLAIRTKQGISIELLKSLGYDILKKKKDEIFHLKKQNLIKIRNKHIILTKQGLVVANGIILELV